MRMIRALAVIALAGPALAETVPEPDGYHGEPYRSTVPATLMGQPGLTADEALALHEAGAAFVDVLPREARPEGLPEGTIWRDVPHSSIPGALWLPNTGYDALAPSVDAYFRRGMEQATGGNLAAPVVIFCKVDCWMSWNAARRAIVMGYTGIQWFPGGVEAWQDIGEDLVEVKPLP